jgi:hypothetical protein
MRHTSAHENGRQFTLAANTRQYILTIASGGVTVWTAYEVLMFWAMANGYAPMLTWATHPFSWFVAFVPADFVWERASFTGFTARSTSPFLSTNTQGNHATLTWDLGRPADAPRRTPDLRIGLVHCRRSAPRPYPVPFAILCVDVATTHTGLKGMVIKDKNRLKLGTFLPPPDARFRM